MQYIYYNSSSHLVYTFPVSSSVSRYMLSLQFSLVTIFGFFIPFSQRVLTVLNDLKIFLRALRCLNSAHLGPRCFFLNCKHSLLISTFSFSLIYWNIFFSFFCAYIFFLYVKSFIHNCSLMFLFPHFSLIFCKPVINVIFQVKECSLLLLVQELLYLIASLLNPVISLHGPDSSKHYNKICSF